MIESTPESADKTVGDLYGVLQHEDPSNDTVLVVEILQDGVAVEIPVRAIHWSRNSWGDNKLIFDATA